MVKKAFITFTLFILGTSNLCSQESGDNKVKTDDNGGSLERPSNPIFKKGATSIKNPLDLRDPFKRKPRKLGRRRKTYGKYLQDGKYSNLPSIENTPLNQIRIVGILLGKNRRALAKIVEGQDKLGAETYIVREGMKIGENKAEVRAIVPGGIVLVEKIKNVYDQEEYIETIIPVSSEVL